jgi:Kef-type K+ transport system membrane component KefB
VSPQTVFSYVLVDLVVIITAAWVFGTLAHKVGQPRVVGEIVAGIALGPSLLGALPGHVEAMVFPPQVMAHLKVLAGLGLVLFMFAVGLELDPGPVLGGRRRALTISLASVFCPFGFGAALAWVLYPSHGAVADHQVPKVGFVLFMGVAMAITAFPVLARILNERGLDHTTVGAVALSAAAVGDVVAWTMLSVAYAVVTNSGPAATLRIVLLTPLFVVVMIKFVRPAANAMVRHYQRVGSITTTSLSLIVVGVFASAWATQIIGVHEIFGAFMFGAVMPRAGADAWRREILDRLHQLSVVVLLPVFFVVAGFGVDLKSFRHAGDMWSLALIIVLAVAGKAGGAFAGARIERMSLRHSITVAVLMNTRGLTELVILLVGLQAGVLDTGLYTMLVLMALVTTAMTGPLLRLVYSDAAVSAEARGADTAREVATAGNPRGS